MTTNEFLDIIRSGKKYTTPDIIERSLLNRMIWRSDIWFYCRLIGVIRSGAYLAARGRFDIDAWATRSVDTLKAVEACGGKLTVTGSDRLIGFKPPAVFVANHMSMIETMALGFLVIPFGPLSIVLKRSLLSYPYLGKVLKASEPIDVERKDPRADFKRVMEMGVEKLNKGVSILIFPQSTRSPNFIPSEFNSMGAKLAAKAGVPLIPIALRTDFLGIGKIIRDFGPVDRTKPILFEYGPILHPTGNGREAHRATVDFIEKKMHDWGVPVIKGKDEDAGKQQ